MILFDKESLQKWEVIDIENFGIDLITVEPCTLKIAGEFIHPEGKEIRFLYLEIYPFGQQLVRVMKRTIKYDFKTDITEVKVLFNSFAFQHWDFPIWSATEIGRVVNTAWRNSLYTTWPVDHPWGFMWEFKVIGLQNEFGYLDIKDYTNLAVPLSEVYRQLILNQGYMEIPDPRYNRVNLVQRIQPKQYIHMVECVDVIEEDKEKEVPDGYILKLFDPKSELGFHDTIAYYQTYLNEDGLYELEFFSEPDNNVPEYTEVLLVEPVEDGYEYDDARLRNIVQTKLDGKEFDNCIEIYLDKNNSYIESMDKKILFCYLGEVVHFIDLNGFDTITKLTGIKYDFDKQLYIFKLGTKRKVLSDILRKDLKKYGRN